MKKAVAVMFLVAFAAATSNAAVIHSDDFDSYANQAALNAVYTQLYANQLDLVQNKGYSDGQSITPGIDEIDNPNSTNRMYLNFGMEVDPSDAEPLKMEFMIDLSSTTDWWSREYIELRNYSGSGYNDGSLVDLIALGVTSSGVDTAQYNYRTLTAGWGNISPKLAGWQKLTALVKTSTVQFSLNDVPGPEVAWGGSTLDCIVIGSGLSSRVQIWFDDLLIEQIPEPSSLALLAVGGLFLRRRRRA